MTPPSPLRHRGEVRCRRAHSPTMTVTRCRPETSRRGTTSAISRASTMRTGLLVRTRVRLLEGDALVGRPTNGRRRVRSLGLELASGVDDSSPPRLRGGRQDRGRHGSVKAASWSRDRGLDARCRAESAVGADQGTAEEGPFVLLGGTRTRSTHATCTARRPPGRSGGSSDLSAGRIGFVGAFEPPGARTPRRPTHRR